jgi:hypothetical protein
MEAKNGFRPQPQKSDRRLPVPSTLRPPHFASLSGASSVASSLPAVQASDKRSDSKYKFQALSTGTLVPQPRPLQRDIKS